MKENIINFRCKHRHSALTHPNCYLRYLQGLGVEPPRIPKILILDLETALLKAVVYQKSVWKANITDDNVTSEWFALTWSAKWLYDDEIMSSRLTGKEAINEDDSRIIKQLWDLFNQADIIIAHNASGFDVPNINTRFLLNDLPPTRPYQLIDTLQVARKQFGFTHNSLDALAKLFGLGEKVETNFELWKACTNGDETALAKMETYNKHDVELLEGVYLKLRPWIKSHPNVGLYMLSDGAVCPNCGSDEIKWIPDTFYYTQTQKYPVFRCVCGAYGRSRFSILTKEEKKNLVTGLAK